jgi:integrase
MRDTPGAANRCLGLLSKILNLAERWGLRPDGTNPCRFIERNREAPRERYLTGEELGRLGSVLLEAEVDGTAPPTFIALVRLLIFTGARLGEIQKARWEWIHGDVLRLPDSKTGRKDVHLPPPALAVLASLPRVVGNPHVIAGEREGGYFIGVWKAWGKLRERAGLPDVRLHDLRHTFASVGAGSGMGLPMIGALLGHHHAATTQRYAHLAADPLKAAARAIGSEIAAAMGQAIPGEPSAEVVDMARRRK